MASIVDNGSRRLCKSSTTEREQITRNYSQKRGDIHLSGHIHGIPSAVMSCILQHDDIIRIANLSTTRMRHSFALGLHAGDFPLKRITSFIISIQIRHEKWHQNKIRVRKNGIEWVFNQRVRSVIAIYNMIMTDSCAVSFAWKIDSWWKAIKIRFFHRRWTDSQSKLLVQTNSKEKITSLR